MRELLRENPLTIWSLCLSTVKSLRSVMSENNKLVSPSEPFAHRNAFRKGWTSAPAIYSFTGPL